jgi:serine/threonine-protein phosphatase 2A regulatory subunit B'
MHNSKPDSGPLYHRLKNAPIDQIPISKAPRRQKSSRFYVTEKVQLELTPAFHGNTNYKERTRGRILILL